MGVEIERKYLVFKERWDAVPKTGGKFYRQGYILHEKDKTVRVRLTEDEGFITIKGSSNGISRAEYEYSIPLQDAQDLLDGFCKKVLEKIRYTIKHDGKVWEVDEFKGDNEGLIVAEIELNSEDELFALPHWVSTEVTGEERYYNAVLSTQPYNSWAEKG